MLQNMTACLVFSSCTSTSHFTTNEGANNSLVSEHIINLTYTFLRTFLENKFKNKLRKILIYEAIWS